MEVTIDAFGRVVIPQPLRDALGLTPGTVVDVSRCGPGLQLVPVGQTARLAGSDGGLVAESSTEVTDEVVLDLLDAGRR